MTEREVLERIKQAVERNNCSIRGAFDLRQDIKAILAEAELSDR